MIDLHHLLQNIFDRATSQSACCTFVGLVMFLAAMLVVATVCGVLATRMVQTGNLNPVTTAALATASSAQAS